MSTTKGIKVGGRSRSIIHGASAGNKRTPELSSYANAKTRCCNPNDPNYPYYGGRGIEFRFNSFVEFLNHVGLRPTLKHSLDRIDVNGHYEKGNVRWANQFEQLNNLRRNIRVTVDGETKTIGQWSKIFGVKRGSIRNRMLISNWCAKCAVTIPLNGGTCLHKK